MTHFTSHRMAANRPARIKALALASVIAVTGAVMAPAPAAALDPALGAAIKGAAGPIAEEMAKRFPKILPAISSSIKRRRKRKESVIEQIRIEPMQNNSIMVFPTVRCGMHRDNKKGRMRYRRLNVWINNRLVLENHLQDNRVAQRAMTDSVLIRNAIRKSELRNAIRAGAKSMTFVVRTQAMCETYDERQNRFTGKKKHRKTREVFGKIKLDLVRERCWTYLKSCKTAIAAIPKPTEVKIVSFKPTKARHASTCPIKVPFVARIRTKGGPVAGRAWLAYEDGTRSSKQAWKMRGTGSATSTLVRTVKGRPGHRTRGWAQLVLRWKDRNGNTRTRKSAKARFSARCSQAAAGGLRTN